MLRSAVCGLSDLQKTSYVDTFYVLRGYMSTCHVIESTCYVPCGYILHAIWVSLYEFPPLVSFEGRFACGKWFCFLELKIKNDWGFGFRYGIFSGKEIMVNI